jgi:hypothetical protein
MPILQVTLTEQQMQTLHSLALNMGKSETDLIAEAIDRHIAQQAALQQAKGVWQDRTDLPDSRALREEGNRYSVSTETTAVPLVTHRYDVEVRDEGRVELQVPFPRGSHLVVYVTEEPAAESFADLVAAASTSLDFWDNALDDEDWNNA